MLWILSARPWGLQKIKARAETNAPFGSAWWWGPIFEERKFYGVYSWDAYRERCREKENKGTLQVSLWPSADTIWRCCPWTPRRFLIWQSRWAGIRPTGQWFRKRVPFKISALWNVVFGLQKGQGCAYKSIWDGERGLVHAPQSWAPSRRPNLLRVNMRCERRSEISPPSREPGEELLQHRGAREPHNVLSLHGRTCCCTFWGFDRFRWVDFYTPFRKAVALWKPTFPEHYPISKRLSWNSFSLGFVSLLQVRAGARFDWQYAHTPRPAAILWFLLLMTTAIYQLDWNELGGPSICGAERPESHLPYIAFPRLCWTTRMRGLLHGAMWKVRTTPWSHPGYFSS